MTSHHRHDHSDPHHEHHEEHTGPTALEIDPVCGMKVDPARAAGRADHGGRTYYFCNPKCRERFVADPERYLNKPAPPVIRAGQLLKIELIDHVILGRRSDRCPQGYASLKELGLFH